MFKINGCFKKGLYPKIIVVIAIISIICGVFYFADYESSPGISPDRVIAAEMELRAAEQDSLGISTETDFILISRVELNPAVIRNCLTVEPNLKFTVEEIGSDKKQFRIIPQESLQSNKVYRFQLKDNSWAFQTRSDFRVIRTLPRDKAYGVPVNSGIEITFSHDNYKDLKGYFEITPNVEGFFERHKRTAVFVPKKLEPGTIYTVKIKKELGVIGSDETLKEDYTFQFETQEASGTAGDRGILHIYFYRNLYEYPTDERPLLDFSYYRSGRAVTGESFKVDLYRYRDAEQFIKALEDYYKTPYWAGYARRKYREDTSNLTKVATFETPVQEIGHSHFILLPETLKEGFYLAEIMCEDQVNQVRLQITDTSGYISVAVDKTLVWVNNLKHDSPVPGTTVELENSQVLGKTREDGTLVFSTPENIVKSEEGKGEEAYRFLKLISPEKSICVVPIYKGEYGGYNFHPQYNYWNYVYFDRELYLPEDTVFFWGIIKPREGIKSNRKITLELTKSGCYDYYYESIVISREEIEMTEDYTFSGNIKLPNLSPGYYEIVFKIEGEEITRKWFSVETYTKPAYRIDIEQEKMAVFSSKEGIEFNIKATFFEGTPVSSMELGYHSSFGSGGITTNEKGEASITLLPQYREETWAPYTWEYLNVYNTLPEAGEIRGQARFMVFHHDMNLTGSTRITDEGAEIKVKLNRITLDSINNKRDNDRNVSYDYIGAPVSGHTVRGQIFENRWEKKESGQYYDFINKEVRTRYTFRHYQVHIMDFTVTTDRSGEGVFAFPYEQDKSYTINLSTVDGMERTLKTQTSLYGRVKYYEEPFWDYYHLEEKKTEERHYGIGEEYTVTFKNHQTTLPEGEKNHYLFLINRKGLKEYKVINKPYFSSVFEEADIPNLYITGVYFDGRTYHPTSPYNIDYNCEERKLNIEVTADKESYRPGEEVTLEIKVTDTAGKPRKAEVNVSLVDEALFMLMGQSVDTLRGIYSSRLPSGIITTYYTHWCPDISDKVAAECGGEGDSERKDFRDTAFFGTVKTDGKGYARLTFRVPDNLTSWRVTYQGITTDLWAGNGSMPIKVKLPFFVDMVINETYLEGDKPVISVRSFGASITPGDKVEFSVKSPSLFDGEKVYTGEAFKTVSIPLPELKEGKHTVTVKGTAENGLKDILTREIKVYKSYLKMEKTDYYTLKKGMKIKGSEEGLTKLVFTDEGRGKFLSPLYGLYYSYGKRIEQRVARYYSYKLLKEYYDADLEEPDEMNSHSYQTPDGGISILPYSDSEPELSAKIASIAPELFDINSLKGYFYKIILESGESAEETCAALWGLAALGEPVLNQINGMLEMEDISVKAKLYLGLASWELGNGNAAKALFGDITEKYGEVVKPYIRINSGRDRDDVIELTSLAAALGSRVGAPEAGYMFNYIYDSTTKDILTYLEVLIYLATALADTDSEPVSFTYSLDGEKIEKELKGHETYKLLLTPDKLAEFKVLDTKGPVGLACIYETTFEPETLEESKDITLTRTYTVDGKPAKEFKESDLIKIVIDYKFTSRALEGRYQITDFLPSGMKIVAAPYTRGLSYHNIRYPYEISGQKVSFYIYNYDKGYNISPIVYYARVVSKGEFRAQGALIQNLKAGGVMKTTEEERIIVK